MSYCCKIHHTSPLLAIHQPLMSDVVDSLAPKLIRYNIYLELMKETSYDLYGCGEARGEVYRQIIGVNVQAQNYKTVASKTDDPTDWIDVVIVHIPE